MNLKDICTSLLVEIVVVKYNLCLRKINSLLVKCSLHREASTVYIRYLHLKKFQLGIHK